MQKLNRMPASSNAALIFFVLYSVHPRVRRKRVMQYVVAAIGVVTLAVLVYLGWVLLKGDEQG